MRPGKRSPISEKKPALDRRFKLINQQSKAIRNCRIMVL